MYCKNNSVSKIDYNDSYLEPLDKIISDMNSTWIVDDNVLSCYKCKIKFNLLIRKHHCRLCGKIFCDECTNKKRYIPDDKIWQNVRNPAKSWSNYFNYFKANQELELKRICDNCNVLLERYDKIETIIKCFCLIDLNIIDIKNAGEKLILWKYTGNHCLSVLRNVQYKLNDTYSELEISLIRSNLNFFFGHNKYILAALKICENENDVEKVLNVISDTNGTNIIVECTDLLCTRNCQMRKGQNDLSSFDAINILCFSFKKTHSGVHLLKKLGLKYLNCNDDEFKCYVPLLVQNIINDDDDIISSYLMERCAQNYDLIYYFYWLLVLNKNKDSTFTKIIKKMSVNEYYKEILKCDYFFDIIKTIDDKKKHKCNVMNVNEIIYPLDTSKKIIEIDMYDIKYKNSASKPMVIKCKTIEQDIVQLLYKKENLIKDIIVMNIIKLSQIILNKDENLDLDIVTYNIIPFDYNSGIIEVISNSETIYNIINKFNLSLLNYILEKNNTKVINEIKDKYIKSIAFYSVITYLLGIGDRHLDNIMITENAEIFHIDYSHVLGQDPLCKSNYVKLTNQMLDVIGGPNSKYYDSFIDYCVKIHNCLRKNAEIILNILLLLTDIDNTLTSEYIIGQVMSKFIPNESDYNANIYLMNVLEENNYTEKIKDWCHYHSKEQTLNFAFSKIGSTLGTISNIFSGSFFS